MALVPHGGGGGSYLMPVPPLTTTSYTSWVIKVEVLLDAQGLWGVVAPAEGATIDAGKSKMAQAMLLGALSEEVLLPVSTKPTAKEVCESLKVLFVGADRVRAARLTSLRGEFERLRMADGDDLDSYAGKLGAMTARYAGLGAVLDDAAFGKKMLDTVSDRLYPAVAGIEQFCDVETMALEEALGRLKAFEERTRHRGQDGDRRDNEELLPTVAHFDHDDDGAGSTASGGGGKRRGCCYSCGERNHFKRECPKLQKAPAAERARLADVDVEDADLL
ncbi:uncharacterized protein [Aegilops tauschii subsp. strangulata]|uniref:uncharacterized protein n=1 Tax=Aegilops tauschii subsp. strangulata TaxID=200361 RepID=UPI00098A940B|nr:uncharacterized protein LOC109762303 [Aegilops tauschii subsp. strangulata]